MSTYYNIYLAVFKSIRYISHFLGSPQTAQVVDSAGKITQPVLERIVMLKGQNGGRHQYGHLLVVGHCLECRPHGNLGLAESHVSAYQTVHRAVALHVFFHRLHSLDLIRSLLILER